MSVEPVAVEPLLGGEAFTIEASGAPVLVASRCARCDGLTFPRSVVCSSCGSDDVRDERQPTSGTLYTHTRVHVAHKRWGGPASFGYIDLPSGLRVFAHLEGEQFVVGETLTLALAPRGLDGDRATTFVFRRGDA